MSYLEKGEYQFALGGTEVKHAPCGESLGTAYSLADALAMWQDHEYGCQVDRGVIIPRGSENGLPV